MINTMNVFGDAEAVYDCALCPAEGSICDGRRKMLNIVFKKYGQQVLYNFISSPNDGLELNESVAQEMVKNDNGDYIEFKKYGDKWLPRVVSFLDRAYGAYIQRRTISSFTNEVQWGVRVHCPKIPSINGLFITEDTRLEHFVTSSKELHFCTEVAATDYVTTLSKEINNAFSEIVSLMNLPGLVNNSKFCSLIDAFLIGGIKCQENFQFPSVSNLLIQTKIRNAVDPSFPVATLEVAPVYVCSLAKEEYELCNKYVYNENAHRVGEVIFTISDESLTKLYNDYYIGVYDSFYDFKKFHLRDRACPRIFEKIQKKDEFLAPVVTSYYDVINAEL